MADIHDVEKIFEYVKSELALYSISWYDQTKDSNGLTKWSEYSVSAHDKAKKALRLTIKLTNDNELEYSACLVFNDVKDSFLASNYLKNFTSGWDKRRDEAIHGNNVIVGIFASSKAGSFAEFYTDYSVAKSIVDAFKTLFFNNDIEKIAKLF